MPSPIEMMRTPASRKSSSSTRPRLLRRERREKSFIPVDAPSGRFHILFTNIGPVLSGVLMSQQHTVRIQRCTDGFAVECKQSGHIQRLTGTTRQIEHNFALFKHNGTSTE